MALWVWDVDRYVLVKEKDEEEGVAIDGRKVKDIVPRGVEDQRVCSGLKEKMNNVVVASLRSPHGWCSM